MNSIERVKAWLTPIIITAFGVVFWALISEIRSDVKSLLRTTAQSDVRIENLERRVDKVETIVTRSNALYAIKPEEVEVPKRATR
jgi:hypothetical protein